MDHSVSIDQVLPRRTSAVNFLSLLFSASSALLVIYSFPPYDLGFLAWFGLSPLFFALRRRGMFSALGGGFLFGCLFGIGAFYWATVVPSITPFNFLVMLITLSLYFIAFGYLYRLISKGIGSWNIIGAPALWVAMEYTRSNLFFLSLPWNLMGHSQYHYLPVIQIADLTGVYGISFLIVMVNQIFSHVLDVFLLRRRNPSSPPPYSRGMNWVGQVLVVSLMLVFTFSYGWYKLATQGNAKQLRVALVQANVLTWDNMPVVDQVKHLQAYEGLTRKAATGRPDLIVWPASSLPAPIRYVNFSVRKLARETGSYILVGGAGMEKFGPLREGFLPFSNSEFLIAPSGRIIGQYDKIRLTPFNEYLPLQGRIKWPKWITTLKESFVPGKKYTLFEISRIKFGTPICSENMFPDLFRCFVKDGANFMVSVTNEGFFGHTAAPHQTLASNVFRAVENRVAIVRSATTGVSAFINPSGEIIERVQNSDGKDLFVSGFLVRDVPLSDHKTFYTVYGDIFAYVAVVFVAFMIVASLFKHKWSRSQLRI